LNNVPEFVSEICIWALPTIFAIILHEVMHGVVALRLGDDTALRAGRLTLNPIAHVDPIGTIVLPAILIFLHAPVFGYAKPVPVDFRRLHPQRAGMMMVAAAGPLTNLTLAAISIFLMLALQPHLAGQWAPTVWVPIFEMLRASLSVNVALGIFNLIPILPLDGGRVLVSFLPIQAARAMARFESVGFLLLFALLYSQLFNMILSQMINVTGRSLIDAVQLVYYSIARVL
jgi:Zn-dependent protease